MDKEKIELIIEQKIRQYAHAQKIYHGDSYLSNKLEADIEALEEQLKEVNQ